MNNETSKPTRGGKSRNNNNNKRGRGGRGGGRGRGGNRKNNNNKNEQNKNNNNNNNNNNKNQQSKKQNSQKNTNTNTDSANKEKTNSKQIESTEQRDLSKSFGEDVCVICCTDISVYALGACNHNEVCLIFFLLLQKSKRKISIFSHFLFFFKNLYCCDEL